MHRFAIARRVKRCDDHRCGIESDDTERIGRWDDVEHSQLPILLVRGTPRGAPETGAGASRSGAAAPQLP